MKKIIITFFAQTLFFTALLASTDSKEIPLFKQGLQEATSQALANSNILKSATATSDAANSQAESASAGLLPNLSIMGAYSYQKEVQATVLPFGNTILGEHENYAVGPVINYTLFDGGKDRAFAKSLELLAQVKKAGHASFKKQVELLIAQTYFRTQYALRELTHTAKLLKLSQDQGRDINLRFRAGAASRLDQTLAHREVIGYKVKFMQAQTNLASNIRDLMALTGETGALDTARPIPEELANELPDDIDLPTLKVSLDNLLSTLKEHGNFNGAATIANHPEVQLLQNQKQAALAAIDSERAAMWPKIALQAKTQYIFPEIGIEEKNIQSSFGFTLSFSVFDWGIISNRVAQKSSEALSAQYQKNQKEIDLSRDYSKAKDSLSNLLTQQKLGAQNIKDAREVEQLTYQAYQAGKVRYLDVQDANLKLLQTEVNLAQIESTILMQTAVLNYLTSN